MESELRFEPIEQEAWYLQIKDELPTSKRTIDKMSIAEILTMYDNKKFLCDTCDKELGKYSFSLEDHIAHMINPIIVWSCEDCLMRDVKQGNIIGSTKEPKPELWQTENI